VHTELAETAFGGLVRIAKSTMRPRSAWLAGLDATKSASARARLISVNESMY
jgi:hypothetical protein